MDIGERVRRLRAARATGHVPEEILTWVIDLAARECATQPAVVSSPAERLGLVLSEEVDRWMRRRGVTHRTISVNRRSLSRALKGGNVTLATIADVADALRCDAVIEFRSREG